MMLTLLVQAAGDLPAVTLPAPQTGQSPTEYIVAVVLSLLPVFLTWFLRQHVKSKALADGISLVTYAASTGARVAWSTYTAACKEASKDGSLTDEEKAAARSKAFDAAKASIGARGLATLRASFGSGWEDALRQQLEAAYLEMRDPAPVETKP